jgi:hypothetical protein
MIQLVAIAAGSVSCFVCIWASVMLYRANLEIRLRVCFYQCVVSLSASFVANSVYVEVWPLCIPTLVRCIQLAQMVDFVGDERQVRKLNTIWGCVHWVGAVSILFYFIALSVLQKWNVSVWVLMVSLMKLLESLWFTLTQAVPPHTMTTVAVAAATLPPQVANTLVLIKKRESNEENQEPVGCCVCHETCDTQYEHCQHAVCPGCARRWYSVQKTCPICRRAVDVAASGQ